MANIEYSVDALEAKCLFYNKSITVFVEGQDDVLFWKYLFDIANINAHIEDVGSDTKIKKYIIDILDNDAGFVVACDNNHNDFLKPKIDHPQIINTYGYSIENSMYNINKLEEIVSKLSRQSINVKSIIEDWVDDFCSKIYELLKYDIANHKYKKGIPIFGNSCSRFLKSNSSHWLCTEKIDKFLKIVKNDFSRREINDIEKLLRTTKKDFWFLIKGHFLTNATMNLIKTLVKEHSGIRCQVSADMIYSLTIDCSEDWSEKVDISTVVRKIKNLKIA